jgi:hypothetical protein
MLEKKEKGRLTSIFLHSNQERRDFSKSFLVSSSENPFRSAGEREGAREAARDESVTRASLFSLLLRFRLEELGGNEN